MEKLNYGARCLRARCLRLRPLAPADKNPESQILKSPPGKGAKPRQLLSPTSGGTKGPPPWDRKPQPGLSFLFDFKT